MNYTTKNHRPNTNKVSIDGSPRPHEGQVIADLYDEDGNFSRSSVIADCGSLTAAKRYCEEANKLEEETVKEFESSLGIVPQHYDKTHKPTFKTFSKLNELD